MKLFGEKKILDLDSKQKKILEDVKREWSKLVSVSDKNPTNPETDKDIDWLYDTAGFSKPKTVIADSFEEYQKIPSFTCSTKSLFLSYPINHNIDKKFRNRL